MEAPLGRANIKGGKFGKLEGREWFFLGARKLKSARKLESLFFADF